MCGNRWFVLTWSWVGRFVVVGARDERFLGVRGLCVSVILYSAENLTLQLNI